MYSLFKHIIINLVYLECSDGDVHLAGSLSDFEGTVEICFGNIWGLIAENGWGVHDAQVVCRQLGFLSVCKFFRNIQVHLPHTAAFSQHYSQLLVMYIT